MLLTDLNCLDDIFYNRMIVKSSWKGLDCLLRTVIYIHKDRIPLFIDPTKLLYRTVSIKTKFTFILKFHYNPEKKQEKFAIIIQFLLKTSLFFFFFNIICWWIWKFNYHYYSLQMCLILLKIIHMREYMFFYFFIYLFSQQSLCV